MAFQGERERNPRSDARLSAKAQGHFIPGSNRGEPETTIRRPAPPRRI